MGFLDMFDNPNILSALLGGTGDLGSPSSPPAPPPAPPPTMPPPQGLNYGPAGTTTQNGMPIAQGFDSSLPAAAPPTFPPVQGLGGPAGTAMQNGMPIAQGFDNSAPSVAPSPMAPPGPQGPVPLPPPRPNIELPPNATTTIGQGTPGGPLAAAPPPMPPASQFNPATAPPTSNTGGGLRAALGLDQSSWVRPAVAGLGRGLSAVSQMRPGTFGAANFAAGAGGALQGTEASRNQQEQQQRQKQNDLFNQSSTAFKDMLAAKTADNTEGYRQAQGQYLRARAASLLAGGNGRSTSAWQATPYGKVIQVENEAQKYEKGQQIILQKQWQTNGATSDQQQKDLDGLKQRVDAYRKRLYGAVGIDPDKAAKIKDMGTSQDNPFDTKGMSLEQFHDQVPMGAWYKDQNGVVRQRTVPPPGAAGGASSAAPAASPAATNDDYLAMTPAA